MEPEMELTETIQVPFVAEYEKHNKNEFQKAGHMVFPLRYRDAEGNPMFGPGERPWEGDDIHILRISLPSDPSVTVLRVMSDSLEDAKRMVVDELPRGLFALHAGQFIRQQGAVSIEKLQREQANLLEWCSKHHSEKEIEIALAGGGL